MDTVDLGGETHAVTVPRDFAICEELVVAYSGAVQRGGVSALRAGAAILGLCTRLGRLSGADYAAHRFDALAYGGEVYGWLRRSKRCEIGEIGRAASAIFPRLLEATFPREAEVEGALGNSEGSAVART